MALDKFFCKVADTKANDKSIEFPSEKEAIEYCKENGINTHGIILMGDKYIIKTKDSCFKTTMEEAISTCDMKAKDVDPKTEKAVNKALRSLSVAIDDFEHAYIEASQNGDMQTYKRMKLILEKLKNVKG